MKLFFPPKLLSAMRITLMIGHNQSLNLQKNPPHPNPPDPNPPQPQPHRGQTFSQPYHDRSSSNVQDIYQHGLSCQGLPHLSSLQ